MAGFVGHLAGGALVAGLAIYGARSLGYLSNDVTVLGPLAAVALASALFPDVDTNSKGRHLFYRLALLGDAALIYFNQYKYAAFLGLLAMLPAVGSHRGWTHTWWAMLVVPAFFALAPYLWLGLAPDKLAPYYLAAVTGYFSHLLLDGKFK